MRPIEDLSSTADFATLEIVKEETNMTNHLIHSSIATMTSGQIAELVISATTT